MAQEDIFKKLVAHCKEYGYVFQSSEIYDGLAAVYDYGQYGVELKNNIKKYWWDSMVLLHENVVGLDSAIFMHPTIWKASGHVDAFNDPLIDNKDSKKRYRADVLIEDHIAKYDDKIEKDVAKAKKRFGEKFDETLYRQTNPQVQENIRKKEELTARMAKALNDNDLIELRQIIVDNKIVCPISGTSNWTEVRQFNLMFSTEMGSTAEGASKIYLRPETAQGIFVNFLNVQKSGRMKIPFGIAQIGKAFRNEIVARQFIFRMREFEQMEMQFFVRPGSELDWFKKWKETRMSWHQALGFGPEKYRFHDHEKLAHYANAATDIEFRFPFGFKEVEETSPRVLREENTILRSRVKRIIRTLRDRNINRCGSDVPTNSFCCLHGRRNRKRRRIERFTGCIKITPSLGSDQVSRDATCEERRATRESRGDHEIVETRLQMPVR